jgi:predicted enzyme related to lactoylglutathione lyase
MTSTIRTLTFDCGDPVQLARFWAAVLGYDDSSMESDHEAVWVPGPDGQPAILFIVVPEGKTAKNRIHFDVTPSTTRDEEVERILGLGGTVMDDRRNPDGTGWVVMQDPEGNEFCVERSTAERGAPPVA